MRPQWYCKSPPSRNGLRWMECLCSTHSGSTLAMNAMVAMSPDTVEIADRERVLARTDFETPKDSNGPVVLGDPVPGDVICQGMVGRSMVLRNVVTQLETVAATDSTVLICGETGTGKELIARAVHNLSTRRGNAFVKCNCAAIPTGLLESELFGHEKGAFTGAVAQRIGRFEVANGGTIFLDEIGEVPLELQTKLLRVLQEREFERLGSSRTLRTDCRL